MSEHFALQVERLGKASFWIGVLPHFSAIVEKNTSDEKVGVEIGVDRGERHG